MVVSKSVSVSKVSVKMGDVTEQGERGDLNNLETFLDPALYDAYGVASLPIVNPRATDQSQLSMRPTDQSQHPEMLLRYLLDQLQQVATVSVGSEGGEQYPQDSDEYQLVYRDEDYYSDYNLDHLSDDYLDYLYQIYDDLDNEITYYDDDLYDDNDAAAAVSVVQKDHLSGAFSRSGEAEGRALEEDMREEDDREEDVTELFDNVVAPGVAEVAVVSSRPVNSVVNKYVDKFLNISREEEVREDNSPETTMVEDFVVDVALTASDNSDIYIKIGIFITVSLAVLIMTGGLIFVMMRRKIVRKLKTVAESSLVTSQDEAASNQVVFQRGLRTSTTTSLQEHFNNHFGKSGAAYLYDDLHSLDNDSFLTSLETISERDRWE